MHYVFYEGELPELHGSHSIISQYDFGEAGGACKVDSFEPSVLVDHEGVCGVEQEAEFRPQTHFYTSDDVATIEDTERLHNVTDDHTGEGVTVVVMDSGIDTTHPVFSDTDVGVPDPNGLGPGDSVGHGTAVAGQIVRLAPDVNLVDVRIFGSSGSTGMDKILRAYEWLVTNADSYDIVNMSWGSQARVSQLDRIHNTLVSKGVQDVVAAGNTGGKGGSPATAQIAFSAGACTEGGDMAPFSSYNPEYDNPDVSAIGVDCKLVRAAGTSMGEVIDADYTKASGTSFAAPNVAGMVARFVEANGSDSVVRAYEESADDIPDVPKDGSGLANHAAALRHDVDEPDDDTQTGSASVMGFFLGLKLVSAEGRLFPAGQYDVERNDDTILFKLR